MWPIDQLYIELGVKPAKSALRNSDADVGNWMVAKNCSTNVAPRYSNTLFHVSIKMSSEEILIRFDVSDFSV